MNWRHEIPSQAGHIAMTAIPTFTGQWYYGLAIAFFREQAQHGWVGVFDKLFHPREYEDLLWGYLPGFALGYLSRWIYWLFFQPWWY